MEENNTNENININQNKDSMETKEPNTFFKEDNIEKNKEILKIPFGKEFKEEITKMEITSKYSNQYLNNEIKDFLNRNKKLLKEIYSHRDNIIDKYLSDSNSKPLENKTGGKINLIEIIEKSIDILKKINDIYCQIFNSIKDNLEIMNKFIEKMLNFSQNIGAKNPVNNFFTDEFNNIVDCWLFMKIDFDKFDLAEVLKKSNLDQEFRTFINKISKNKNLSIDVACPKIESLEQNEQKKLKEKKEEYKKLIEENKSNLVKIRFENAGNIAGYIGDKSEFDKLKMISINNSEINGGLFKRAKNLEKISIKSSLNSSIEILEDLPQNIKILKLEKINYVNKDLENILNAIFPDNKNILNNLDYLSFAGNNITRLDFSILSPKTIFRALTEMNFKKNKIYKIFYSSDNFPKLRFINCCKNNLNKSYFNDIKNIGSLESGNVFLYQPNLNKKYYENIKGKLEKNDKNLYKTKYLNITYMPKIISIEYFNNFHINETITSNLRKLDLSYNGLNCNTFFNFVNENNGFRNLKSLVLNGNEIDDTFFEKFDNTKFQKLKHLYLNSNKIGDPNIQISYKDNEPIDSKYSGEKDKLLVNKVRLIYNFIIKNPFLNKLTITKNPISEFYSVVPEPKNDADKNEKYIKKNSKNKIVINCLFSLLIKIRDELLTDEQNKNIRKNFNLRFDCRSNVNRNSENYPFNNKPFIYKK